LKVQLIIDGEEAYNQADNRNGGSTPRNTDFAQALQDACDAGEVLTWPQDVAIDQPIVITIDKPLRGPFGLRMDGFKIISRITDGSDLLTFKIAAPGIDCRYLRVQDLLIAGSGLDGNGLVISCPRNDSWIYNFELRGVSVEGCGQAGVLLEGSVFEGMTSNLCTHGNKGDGARMQNFGPEGNVGVVSAITMWGGSHRKNGGKGIYLIGAAAPRDVKVHGAYFCENTDEGIVAENGIGLVSGCGFENNGGAGVALQNYGSFIGCTFSTGGPQLNGITGYLVGTLFVSCCSSEPYGAAISAGGVLVHVTGAPGSKVYTAASGGKPMIAADASVVVLEAQAI